MERMAGTRTVKGRGAGVFRPWAFARKPLCGTRPEATRLIHIEAPDLATLASLQNRLNELSRNLAIRIEEW